MRRKVLTILRTGIIYFVVVFATGEITCRLLGYAEPSPFVGGDSELFLPSEATELGYAMRPGFDGTVYGAPLKTNAFGLRGSPDLAEARVESVSRVVCLGDSVCFGYGLPTELTFPYLMQSRLPGAEVINAGVPGYNTAQEIAWLRHVGSRFQPDFVLLYYVPNDPEVARRLNAERVLEPIEADIWLAESRRVPRLMQFLGRKSRLCMVLDTATAPILPSGRAQMKRVVSYFNEELFEQSGWTDFRRALNDLAEYSQEHDVPTLVAVHPLLISLVPYHFGEHEKRVIKACEEAGLPALSLRPVLAAYPVDRLRLHPQDGHPGAFGHSLIADALAGQVGVRLELLEHGNAADAARALIPADTVIPDASDS